MQQHVSPSWPDSQILVPEREPELYLRSCRRAVAHSFDCSAQRLLMKRFRHSLRVNPSPWRKLWDANDERKRFLTVKTVIKLANKRDYLEAFFKECGKEQVGTHSEAPFNFWITQMGKLAGSSQPQEQEYVWRQVAGEGAFLRDEIFLKVLTIKVSFAMTLLFTNLLHE